MIALWIDDVDARAAYGLGVERATGALDAPPRTTATAAIPGRAGVTPLAPAAEGPRKVAIAGTIIGTSAADARTKLDLLLAAVGGASVRLRTGDRDTRELVARLDTVSAPPPAVSMLARKLPVELTFSATAPYWRDTTDTVVSGIGAIGVADQPLPQGTAPSRPVIIVGGVGTTAVEVTLLDSAGAAVAAMAFDPTGGGMPWQANLVVDLETMRAWYNFLSQTWAALPFLDPDSDLFTVDPLLYGRFSTAEWPRLACDAGTGCSATYRRQWR